MFFRLFLQYNDKLYALKVLNIKKIIERNQVKIFFLKLPPVDSSSFCCCFFCAQVAHTKTERRVLATINHHYIQKLHCAFRSKTRLYFLLNYCSGGEVFYHMQKCGPLAEILVCFYAAEIAMALGCLHHNRIVYRDLKPENIMLDGLGHICLSESQIPLAHKHAH